MSIHVALRHVTHYTYDRLVALGPQVVRLRPAPHCRTGILSYSLRVLPEEHFINWQQDPQSNYLGRLVFTEKVREFRVEVDLVAEMAVYNPFDFFIEAAAERFPFSYDPELANELEPYQRCLPPTPRFAEYLEKARRPFAGREATGAESVPHSEVPVGKHVHGHLPEAGELHAEAEKDPRPRTIDVLVGLNQSVSENIKYIIRLEPGFQTPEETHAATPHGCFARSFGTAGSRPVSSAAILSSSRPIRRRSMARAGPRRISPTCTHGAKSICQAPVGLAWTRPAGCWPAKVTSRWQRRPIRKARRQSPALSSSARRSSISRCRSSASRNRRA